MSMDLKEEKFHGSAEETRVPAKAASSPHPLEGGGQLVSFGERVTYTFSTGKEVGSIHFDRMRGEIFYKGHNIRHMELENWQMAMLEKMRTVLTSEQRTRRFAEPYGKILDKIILEKTKAHQSSP